MEFRVLRSFLAVAREGSVTGAAMPDLQDKGQRNRRLASAGQSR